MSTPLALDVKDVADALGVSTSHVYELVRKNEWPTEIIRLGRVIRFRRDSFETHFGSLSTALNPSTSAAGTTPGAGSTELSEQSRAAQPEVA